MNLTEILNGSDKNKLDKFAAYYRDQTGFSSGAAKLSKSYYSLKKLKMAEGDGLMVVPLFLHLPIDFDGNLLKYDVPYLGTFKSAILSVKYLCNSNTKYATALSGYLGENFNKINLAATDSVSEEENAIFWPFRKPLIYAATVMSVKAADSTYAYGTPYRVTGIAVDPETGNYIDDIKNPLIWKLHRLETACIAAQIKKLNADNAAAGDSRRTDSEMAATIKNLWDNRCISNPYSLGTTRVLWFKTDRNFEIDKSVADAWKADVESIKKNEFYIKVNKSILEQFMGVIGAKKYDRYADFLLIKQTTPAFDEKTRGTAAQKISRTGAGRDEAIEDGLTDFIKVYGEYRDEVESWSENIMLKSAYEYRTITDDAIRTTFKNSMPALSAAMHTTEIVETFGEIIASLDSTLSDTLMENAMEGSLSDVGDITQEIASAPVITEDTPGYGGDSGADTEDANIIMSALVDE